MDDRGFPRGRTRAGRRRACPYEHEGDVTGVDGLARAEVLRRVIHDAIRKTPGHREPYRARADDPRLHAQWSPSMSTRSIIARCGEHRVWHPAQVACRQIRDAIA